MASPGQQLIQFPLNGGLDQSIRDEVVDPTQASLVLENVRQTKGGALYKRFGFGSLTRARTDATTRSAGYRLFSHGRVPCTIDGAQLDAYSATADAALAIGRVPETLVRRYPVAAPSSSNVVGVDVIKLGSYIVVASLSLNTAGTYDVSTEVLDASTFAVVRRSEQVATGLTFSIVKLTGSGTSAVVVYGSSTLRARRISLASISAINSGWAAQVTLITDAVGSTGYGTVDVCALSDRFAVAYANNSGGNNRLTVSTFDASASLTFIETKTIATTATTPSAVACEGSTSDTLWVAWGQGTDVYARGITASSLSTTLGSTDLVYPSTANPISRIGIVVTGTAAAEMVASDGLDLYRAAWTRSGGVVVPGATSTWRRVLPYTKPWIQGGRVYAMVCVPQGRDLSGFCADFTGSTSASTLRPVATVAPRLNTTGALSSMARPVSVSSTQVAVLTALERSSVTSGLELSVLDYAANERWQPCALGGLTFLSGGVPYQFDGQTAHEMGFLVRPVKPAASLGGTGLTATNLRYVAIYEWVDALGNVHWSGTSDPSDAVSPANQTVTITVATLVLTAKHAAASKVRIVLYRSDNGAAYQRLGVRDNDPSALVVSFTDVTSSVADNAYLYSQPGTVGTAQSRSCPPSLSCLVAYNGMLVGCERANLWWSGQRVDGEGMWTSDLFQMPVDSDDDIIALAVMDGTLFAFCRRSIFAVAGEPPSDNGAVGGLGTPRRLAVDVGCIEPRSIVVTSSGIFFQSERGIELLTRAQSVEWVGFHIQDTLASFPVCTAATVDPYRATVLLELASTETANQVSGTGRTAVYDLGLRSWVSIDRRKNASGTADVPAQGGALVYVAGEWRYAWLETNGAIHYEDSTSYRDAGTYWITMALETAWVKASGLQGRQQVNKVLLLAKNATGHDLSLALSYDYASTFRTAQTWTSTQVAAIAAALPNIQVEHVAHDDARCEAIRVRVSDATPSSGSVGTGQGSTWIGLAFEVVPQPGAYQLPDASR